MTSFKLKNLINENNINIEKLEQTMTVHDDYLISIGMKTNVAKTEFTLFSRKQLEQPPFLEVKGTKILPTGTIKVLGVKFRWDLSWDDHYEQIRKGP